MQQADIDNASPLNQFQCAIVRTIQRQYPQAIRVRANKKHIAWTIGEQRFVYDTPQVAVEAVIVPLDSGGTPEPIELQLTNGYVKPVHYREPEEEVKHRTYQRKYQKKNPDRPTGRAYERAVQ